jgi:hypothetical protein
MTISLTIQGDHAAEIISQLAGLLRAGAPANTSEPASVPALIVEEVATVPKTRAGKKPATPPQTIEGTVMVVSEGDPTLTIDQAREHMKAFAAGGFMDEVSLALDHFNAKKVSDIDPDAKPGVASAKFAAFVAKIEEIISAKAA